MRWHPATMMFVIWAIGFLLLFGLPYHIVNREVSMFGYLMLLGGLCSFGLGALARSTGTPHSPGLVRRMPDFRTADLALAGVAVLAMIAFIIDLRLTGSADLTRGWEIRNERASAIISGEASGSSIAFQIGFLLTPVAYAIIAREIIFRPKLNPWRLALLGFGPLIVSSLSQGGRGPLLFGMTFAAFALMTKHDVFGRRRKRRRLSPRTLLLLLVAAVFSLAALNYFTAVFVLRAEGSGGAAGMLELSGDTWGVTFDGPVAEAMKNTIGIGTTYLIFVVVWYLVQGIVIANVLFTSYDGPAHYGIYGIELITATMRRVDPGLVSERLGAIDVYNVFGFLPSAYGSMFVDIGYFFFPASAIWGYVCGLVYFKSRRSADARWLLAVPLIMQGIAFSLLNTPLGLTNGLFTHLWLLALCLLAKPRVDRQRLLTAADASPVAP